MLVLVLVLQMKKRAFKNTYGLKWSGASKKYNGRRKETTLVNSKKCLRIVWRCKVVLLLIVIAIRNIDRRI